jgi:hypothetical protein
MVIPFLQTSTFSGLISTKSNATSEQWYNTFTTVQANSAQWNGGSATTNYLSTNNVVLSSATILNTLSISSVQITGQTTTSVTSTATDLYLKVTVNNNTKYIRLFDIA